MDTFFARNRLSAYLDGDLPTGEAREVEAAIHRDPDLRAEFEQLRGAVEFLRSNGPMLAPDGFANRLHIRLAAEPTPSRLRVALRRVRYDYIGIAAVAAMALIVVGTQQHTDSEPADVATQTVAAAQAPSPVPDLTEPEAGGDARANGVLGDEGGFAAGATPASSPSKKSAPVANKQMASNGVDREPFQPDWERDGEGNQGTDLKPAGQASGSETQSVQVGTLYSPAPWRYRVHAVGANPLKDLMAVAATLGGRIVDAKGRPLADYPMDEGDSAAVRVFVPSYNVEELQRRLKELGTVDTIATDPGVLYQNGTEVPVSIEVQR